MQLNKLMNLGIAVASLIVVVGVGPVAIAQNNQRPTRANIEFAKGTADLLQNEMIAALLQEFNETTAANAAQGKVAIGLVFNDANPAIRLIGNLSPLDPGNVPRDGFERTALFNAVKLNGTPFDAVEQSQDENNNWFYRRSIPLSNFHPACVICHTNFGPQNPNEWVGALTLRVPNELIRPAPFAGRSAPAGQPGLTGRRFSDIVADRVAAWRGRAHQVLA